MKAEQLRKSILQLAIQGKLVPQDPNDEPASVLLERIRAEKQRLIKEGKIKKDKNDSVIFKGDDNRYYEKVGSEIKDITDEINFDLPNGWEYVRLFSLGVLGGGYTPKQNELKPHGLVPYFKVADMNSAGNEKYLRYTNNYLAFKPKKIFPSNSIVFPKNGGAVFTNKKRILTTDSVVDLNTGVFTPTTLINFDYAYLIFSTIDFREYYKGTALPTINNEFMRSIIFGLPPLVEQARIVSEIEKFEPLISEYDKLEQQATKLDDEIYDKLKKSILQYAIRGKLVPQDPNDEPASVLLERIRAEKKAKLGKKYVDSYIYKGDDNCYYEKVGETVTNISDEIPFDLPRNWAYSRLETIITLLSGRDLEPNQYNSQRIGIPYITGASNIENDSLIINRWTTNPATISHKYDLLITCKGTVGTMAFNNIGDMHIARQIMAINADGVCLDYIRIFLESYVLVLQNKAKSFIPGISRQDLLKAVIPIPPFNEQSRIVDRYNTICKQLKDEA